MEQYHRTHKKKVGAGTGGRRKKYRDKKLSHMGGEFAATKVTDEEDVKSIVRGRGGKTGVKLKRATTVNFVKDGKTHKEKIVRVVESHNPEFVRMNIVTKGAVVETKAGKVKVTNRVGQDGVVNGVAV